MPHMRARLRAPISLPALPPATPPSAPPPRAVLRRPPSWEEAKKRLAEPNFMTSLKEYDKDKLDDALLKKVCLQAVRVYSMRGPVAKGAARSQSRSWDDVA